MGFPNYPSVLHVSSVVAAISSPLTHTVLPELFHIPANGESVAGERDTLLKPIQNDFTPASSDHILVAYHVAPISGAAIPAFYQGAHQWRNTTVPPVTLYASPVSSFVLFFSGGKAFSTSPPL